MSQTPVLTVLELTHGNPSPTICPMGLFDIWKSVGPSFGYCSVNHKADFRAALVTPGLVNRLGVRRENLFL